MLPHGMLAAVGLRLLPHNTVQDIFERPRHLNASDNAPYSEIGLHVLQLASASDTFHDSAERFPPPQCHPETRTKILEELSEWSSNADSSSGVLWLYSPPGSGKSGIAQSFCEKLDADDSLGVSFFFKRGYPSRGAGSKLFPTIAYQLALCLPELKKGNLTDKLFDRRPCFLHAAEKADN
ncbi:NWD2 protein [Mycena venus]|uniref:NWD2 protein n=1 Tax=Mycena venus TaxID=2733690 RepID=A0A8H6TSA4_9AGAR|nr:NWD2 protein [Mycena venus]